MEISKENYEKLLPSLRQASQGLTEGERRRFLGQLVLDIGRGGQRLVSMTLGISRHTLRKGIQEIESGEIKENKYHERGRYKTEQLQVELVESLRKIVDGASQTDPQFKSTRLYTRLSARSVKEALIEQGYDESEIPSKGTIYNIMKRMGYKRRKVAKTKPKKNQSD